jgi:hypothetical protein
MTPDQVNGFFDAGESFIENTIAAALVILWLLVVALQLARPYMAGGVHKFTLRLGADLWWIIFVGLRDLLLLQVFLGSFIFFYPDVVAGQPLPITGSVCAVLAFSALLLKLMTKGDADVRSVQAQTLLIGAGAGLYIGAYLLGTQATELTGQHIPKIVPLLVTNTNPDVALPLCYLSAVAVGVLAIAAVAYNLAQTIARRPTPGAEA